jgi:hypothetical protein
VANKHPRTLPSPALTANEQNEAVDPADAPAPPVPGKPFWVVMENKVVAICGTITQVRVGKEVRDPLIVAALRNQNVKLEERV